MNVGGRHASRLLSIKIVYESQLINTRVCIKYSAAQLAKLFISLAVFCTYGLQFFVCLEIAWAKIQDSTEKATTFHNYVLRTVLVTLSGE